MEYEIHLELDKIIKKLSLKDKSLAISLLKKIEEIKESEFLDHYKNLKKPLQKYKRIHITEQFILIFCVDKKNDKIIFRYLEHRDKIYGKKYD
jgi:mRNA-degrading endonuclease RelE of RelBE toxin-antitoxin system